MSKRCLLCMYVVASRSFGHVILDIHATIFSGSFEITLRCLLAGRRYCNDVKKRPICKRSAKRVNMFSSFVLVGLFFKGNDEYKNLDEYN